MCCRPFANKGRILGFAGTSKNHDKSPGRRAIGSKIRLRIKFKINHSPEAELRLHILLFQGHINPNKFN